jgi:hypothetical protein
MNQQAMSPQRQNHTSLSTQVLPVELKTMVLRHILVIGALVQVSGHSKYMWRFFLRLLLIDKETNAVALDILMVRTYSSSTASAGGTTSITAE